MLGLSLAGKRESYGGLIINREKNLDCAETTEELISLFHKACRMSGKLLDEFVEFLYGEGRLSEIYDMNFESLPVE